jgi:hypothetical protein
MVAMDDDLPNLTREELIAEVIRLRAGIRAHRDSSGHDLCWHHPQLWNLLPEPSPKHLAVPDWPQFLRGCIKYREALDRELPNAPRTDAEFDKGVEPLSEREAHFLVLLMPLVLVGDIAAFALCFWWYDLGLPLSIVVAILTPIVLLLGIVLLVRFWPTGSKATGERKAG